jgi:hypothetical protein
MRRIETTGARSLSSIAGTRLGQKPPKKPSHAVTIPCLGQASGVAGPSGLHGEPQ